MTIEGILKYTQEKLLGVKDYYKEQGNWEKVRAEIIERMPRLL